MINSSGSHPKTFTKEDTMGVLVEVVKPLLIATLKSCHTKRLVVELLERYVKTTDNDIDDLISNTVRTALLKNC